jgi:hypothetical protein
MHESIAGHLAVARTLRGTALPLQLATTLNAGLCEQAGET